MKIVASWPASGSAVGGPTGQGCRSPAGRGLATRPVVVGRDHLGPLPAPGQVGGSVERSRERPDAIRDICSRAAFRRTGDENGLEHVAFLNENANARIACVDTGLTLFATGRDAEGYLVGPEFGFNYRQVASQWRMLRERGIPKVYGVYEPGHLRHAM